MIDNRGFSVIELMITIAITGIVIGIISSNLNGLKKITTRFNEQAAFREQYLIFLLKFEEDYQQAEIKIDSENINLDNLMFQRDFNLDGDYFDSGEQIAYRWNNKTQRIDRKSGKGAFQAFLDGVTGFTWSRTSNRPICHQLAIVSFFSPLKKKIGYCRPVNDD